MAIPYVDICAELYRRKNFKIQANTPWGIHEKQLHALKLLNDPEVTQIGYGGSGRCFVAGTLVNTSNGYIPIESIKVGDLVLSENPFGKLEYKSVEKIYQNSSTPKRKMIRFVLNNCEIKSTEHHEYRFENNWIPGRDIAGRVMAICSKYGQSILSKQYGKIIDNWLQGKQPDFNYEACTGQIGVFANYDKKEWENRHNKNASDSCSNIQRESRKQTRSKPFGFYPIKQSGRQFRMVNPQRKLPTFGKPWTDNMEWNFTSGIERGRKSNIYTYGNSSNRNKAEVQTKEIYKGNVRERIQRFAAYDKGYSFGPKLEAREIILDEIKEIHFTTENIETYDLCVSDNHNYVITTENIKVHNSGKSWVAGEWLTMNCIAYPGTGWGLARKELKNLKRTTLLTFFKVFNKYKLEFKKDYSYNQTDSVINFKNGSQIFLIDMAYSPQDPHYSEFGGFELTGAVIDESNESPYKAIEILSGRCGFRLNTKYNLPPRTLEMFNPDKGHVYTRFYLPYKEGRETVKSKFIKALPTDNPDPAVKIWIKNQMELASEITIQRLIHGDFEYDESKDRLIESDAINDYFTNAHVLEGTGFITADIARMGRDSTMIRVWKGLRVIERVEIFKSKITETAAAIKLLSVKYSIPMSRTIVDEDGVGGGCRDILNCHGFIANSKPIGLTNYANLKAQCTFLMAKLINERKVYEPLNNVGLITRIRQEMDWVRELGIDSDGKRRVIPKLEVKEAIRRSPDDWDSIMMRGYFELGTRI